MTQVTAERPAATGNSDLARWAATQRATLRATFPAGEGRSDAVPAEPPPLRGVSSRLTAQFDLPHDTNDVALHRQAGRVLLASGGQEAITIYELDPLTGADSGRPPITYTANNVRMLAWHELPDRQLLLAVAASADSGILRVDPAFPGATQVVSLPAEACGDVAWLATRDGGLLLAASEGSGGDPFGGGPLRIWQVDPVSWGITELGAPDLEDALAVAWCRSPDGSALLAVGHGQWPDEGHVGVWNVDPGTGALAEVAVLDAPPGIPNSLSWLVQSDGRLLLASSGTTMRTWEAASTFDVFTPLVDYPDNYTNGVAWCSLPDGRRLLVSTGVWGTQSDTRLARFDDDSDSRGVSASAGLGVPVLVAACRDGRPQVFVLDIDPPVEAPEAFSQQRDEGVTPREWPAGSFRVDDIVDRMPAALRGQLERYGMAWLARPDGRTWLASGREGGVGVWDVSLPRGAADCLDTILEDNFAGLASVAWHELADGRLLLAAGLGSMLHILRVDRDSGRLAAQDQVDTAFPVQSLAWQQMPNGPLLLAVVASTGDGELRVFDPDTGRIRAGHLDLPSARSVGWHHGIDGRLLLACSDRVWWIDADPAAELGVSAADGGGLGRSQSFNDVYGIAIQSVGDRRALLAVGHHGGEGGVDVWEVGTSPASPGLLATLSTEGKRVDSVAWHLSPDGRLLLAATGCGEAHVHIWSVDAGSGIAHPVASTPLESDMGIRLVDLCWLSDPGGRLFLGISSQDSHVRSRILEVVVDPPLPAAGARVAEGTGIRRAGGARHSAVLSLVAFGLAGLWLPLGLVDDVVTLTAPLAAGVDPGSGQWADQFHNRLLAGLARHPGVAALRSLGWPPLARATFAGLLASAYPASAALAPPSGCVGSELLAALAGPGGAAPGPRPPDAAGLAALQDGAESVTPAVVALLSILGPQAAANDPTLPLRLRDQAGQLPDLPPSTLTLLSTAANRAPDVAATGLTTGAVQTSTHSPNTVRHGPPNRLLPTHLALPRMIRTVQQVHGDLLYRQHVSPAAPPPLPHTIVLDTTPPTFGPIEITLRTVAHLIALTLWQYQAHASLITLTHPARVLPLTSPAHLADLWSSRTLEPPEPQRAIQSAAATGQPVILLTTPLLPVTHHLTASPALKIMTAAYPNRPTRRAPVSPHHHTLPASPSAQQLRNVVHRLLATT
jgi:WD40 repeat protein